ncbi:HAD family hydrolase [Kallotenue papyrolyticum]|uniref:HAD family hydrolase n=1 Tax=Kallotenue papyrolyticum TaxID=1325125 RepID=UPI0004785544|nr:HAD family hydrolase [Kallotenue papyrolyticum]
MTRALILWDVDGTLLRGSGLNARLFLQALQEVYALTEEARRIDYGGKTDGQIVLETLALHGIDAARALEQLPRWTARYVELIEQAAEQLAAQLRVLPGVVETLAALRERGAIQTLLTGNTEAVAALKLRATGLSDWFDLDVGAYGSDDHDRTRLVAVARRKAAARYGDCFAPLVVIGDTPRDIACGRAGAARTVAVATGSFTLAELQAHAPDAALPDLRDTAAALRAILGSP